jgi:sporulation protein YlmC with PRC-barrel domain
MERTAPMDGISLEIRMSGTGQAEMAYLRHSGLELACSADDVRGMVVVDPNGHRLGHVDDLVIDASDRRARLLAVVSGGIGGLAPSECLIPVETVTKVDDRVHVDRDHQDVHALLRRSGGGDEFGDEPSTAPVERPSFGVVYARCGVTPFWSTQRVPVYFDDR